MTKQDVVEFGAALGVEVRPCHERGRRKNRDGTYFLSRADGLGGWVVTKGCRSQHVSIGQRSLKSVHIGRSLRHVGEAQAFLFLAVQEFAALDLASVRAACAAEIQVEINSQRSHLDTLEAELASVEGQ